MSFNLFQRVLKATDLSQKEAGMKALFGSKSLCWKRLPKTPSFINGRIFSNNKISLPWFTYAATAQLLRWSLSDLVVIEYGSGSSTKFFHDNGSKLVYSQEDNAEWFKFVSERIPKSDKIKYNLCTDKSNYVLSPSLAMHLKPGIILIDGSHREACALSTVEYVNKATKYDSPALIILDNSDWFGKTYSILATLEQYTPIDYYGHGPFNSYSWCTTFFINKESSDFKKLFSKPSRPAKPMINVIQDNFSMDI